MRSLLLEDFHNSHEDIVSLFQTLWNESIENIPVLLKALEVFTTDYYSIFYR